MKSSEPENQAIEIGDGERLRALIAISESVPVLIRKTGESEKWFRWNVRLLGSQYWANDPRLAIDSAINGFFGPNSPYRSAK